MTQEQEEQQQNKDTVQGYLTMERTGGFPNDSMLRDLLSLGDLTVGT